MENYHRPTLTPLQTWQFSLFDSTNSFHTTAIKYKHPVKLRTRYFQIAPLRIGRQKNQKPNNIIKKPTNQLQTNNKYKTTNNPKYEINTPTNYKKIPCLAFRVKIELSPLRPHWCGLKFNSQLAILRATLQTLIGLAKSLNSHWLSCNNFGQKREAKTVKD